MTKTIDNGRMLSKGELINSLENMRRTAGKNKKLFNINNANDPDNAFGPIYSTAPEDSINPNKITLYDSNSSKIDSDKKSFSYVFLGKMKDYGVCFSFGGEDFQGAERGKRTPEEVYGFLEKFVTKESNRNSVVNNIFFEMKEKFDKRIKEAQEFYDRNKYKKKKPN